MSAASLDRLLALLVVAMAATGLLTLRAGDPGASWVFVAHGLLAGALGLAVVEKLRTSGRRAIEARRWGRLALGLVVSLVVAAALTGGWAWVASGELLSIGGWTVLTLHAWAGLAVVPLVVLHLVPRRWRLLRAGPDAAGRAAARLLSRRALLAGAAFAVAGAGAYGAAALLDAVRGGDRRFTGSRWLPAGGVPPPTTFFGEPAPVLDPSRWRLAVDGLVRRPLSVDAADLHRLGEASVAAVLDCTSGWALETTWQGVPVGSLLDAAGALPDARTVTVRSATGWSTVLPVAEARACLLATGVAGRPLPVPNGAPVRLVAPGRRGLDWVKWVTVVEVA